MSQIVTLLKNFWSDSLIEWVWFKLLTKIRIYLTENIKRVIYSYFDAYHPFKLIVCKYEQVAQASL